jgi:catalase
MAMINPSGRVNYEPNSWGGDASGPREDPEGGFRTYDSSGEPGATGEKRRYRSETFADHYSQARQFYVSQTEIEQAHIADAFTFELSKVETPEIRARMVANLRNVDEQLAAAVAEGLGLELPERSQPAREPVTDLAESPALSIVRNGPESVAGRKFGILVSDGTSAGVLAELTEAITAAGALFELVAPRVGAVTFDDGNTTPAHQRIDGGPSVLYDAVAVVPSARLGEVLARDAAAKDFVSDAFAHCKFIGYTDGARPLLDAVGVEEDEGVVALDGADAARAFVDRCGALRVWARQPSVNLLAPL